MGVSTEPEAKGLGLLSHRFQIFQQDVTLISLLSIIVTALALVNL